MELFIIVAGIVVILMLSNLSARVKKLEQSIKQDTTKTIPDSNYQTQPQQSTSAPAPLLEYIKQQISEGKRTEEIRNTLIANEWQTADIENALHTVVPVVPTNQSIPVPAKIEPTPIDEFLIWFKEDWLLKLGALLLLIGFGWLTTYAFLNNWIGPMGRIALGIIAGILFLLLGWWRIKKYIHQGGIFLVLGSTVILLTLFAAREIYGFFTPSSALAVMFLSTAFVALMSVKYNSRPLSLASLVLAGVAPFLTSAPTADYIGLFSYLFVVVLGAIWIVGLTGYRELTVAALILVAFYSVPHLSSSTSVDIDVLLMFAYAFVAIFFITNTLGILRLQNEKITPDLVTAAGNGLFLLAWIMVAAPDEWKSLIISAWMIVFAVGAFILFRATQKREPFYVYAGVGIAMLAAATSVELHGATLTIAYTIEAGVIPLIAYSILKDIRIAKRLSLLLIWPAILSFESITSSAWATSVFHKDFFVLLILTLAFLELGLLFLRHSQENTEKGANTWLVVGSFYAYTLLWLSLHAAIQDDNTATMMSLAVYTIIGLIAYFYGLAHNGKNLRHYGGVLVGLVVARLFLVDVWTMDLPGRIATFFIIGILLMSTAFLGRRKQAGERTQ